MTFEAALDELEGIVEKLPPPKGERNKPLKALLVDSWYDVYLGVVVLVRIVDGVLAQPWSFALEPAPFEYRGAVRRALLPPARHERGARAWSIPAAAAS